MPRKPNGKRVVDARGGVSVRAKNGNGQGSVFFAETENAWRASYVLPGEAKRRYVQARTRELVLVKRDTALAAGVTAWIGSTKFSSTTKFGVMAEAWLSTVARHRMRVSTFEETSKRMVRLGGLREVAIGELSSEMLIAWQSQLLDGLAPRTVLGTRTAVNQVFNWAVELGVLTVNPMRRVRPPKVIDRPGNVLAPADVIRLLEATSDHRYGPVIALLFTSGLRVSEALGLSWDDIDFVAGTAVVRRCVMYSSTTGRAFGPPKTLGALGTHFLAPGTVNKLRDWRDRQQAERTAATSAWPTHVYEDRIVAPVFTTRVGDLVSRQHIDALLRRAGMRIGLDSSHLGTHTGRRSLITALYTNGVPLDDIQHHIGHSDARTTAGYVASLGDRPARTAAIAARLMEQQPDVAVTPS